MSFELLRANIEKEKQLLVRLDDLYERSQATSSKKEKRVFDDSIISVKNQIRVLNDSLPLLLNKISLLKPLPGSETAGSGKEELVSLSYQAGDSEELVAIKSQDKEHYIEQLHISESSIKALKKHKLKK